MRSLKEINEEIKKVERAQEAAEKKFRRCVVRLGELYDERRSAFVAEGGEEE